jgi:hypothetical protein
MIRASILMLLASATTAAASPPPRTPAVDAAAPPAAARAETSAPPRVGEVVRVTVVEQALRIEWRSAEHPPDKPLTITGPESQWTVRAPRAIGGAVPGTLELQRPPARAADPGGYWLAFISISPQKLYITGHRGGRIPIDTTLRFTQMPGGLVHLTVMDHVTRKYTQAQAANVIELRASHPQLVRLFLVPLLRQLTGDDPLLPGATDVYRVFSEISPDEADLQAVRAILPPLGHASYSVRHQASGQLEALGPRAVGAVMHMDRNDLMPEQKLRLEALLVTHSRRVINDPQSARQDPVFLADCLEFDDDRVRWLAKRALEQITGRRIPMHHAPTREEWSQAADVMRHRLAKPAGD